MYVCMCTYVRLHACFFWFPFVAWMSHLSQPLRAFDFFLSLKNRVLDDFCRPMWRWHAHAIWELMMNSIELSPILETCCRYVCVCMYLCMCVRTYIHWHVFFVLWAVFELLFMRVRICMHTYTDTYIVYLICESALVYARTYLCTCLCMHTHMYAHAYVCTCICMHMHMYAHAYVCTRICMHMHMYAHAGRWHNHG